MPRKHRIISSSGIYHVMSRGNEKKPIFLDASDYERFGGILRKIKKEKPFTLYAYCFMNTHYHLVFNEEKTGISSIMSSVNTSYAIYFNKKYERVGHLFQGRFRSEAIEDEAYFLTAIKYVHNNPVAAKLVEKASQYPWSSYGSYLQPHCADDLIECRYLLNMLSPSPDEAIGEFVKYSDQRDEAIFVNHLGGEMEGPADREIIAKKFIGKYLQDREMSIDHLKIKSNRAVRNELITILIKKSGLPVREIGKLLGLSKSTISRLG